MKALVKAETAPGLSLMDVDVPEIGPNDILIRIRKTGICGTDMHIWNWDEWAQKTIPVPMVVGHEYAGEIVEIGSHVEDLRIGQRVSGEGHVVGHRSRAARAGKFHLDPETKGIGVHIPGAFAEYLKLPAFNAVPLPDDIDDELGAILDPFGNAVHTALTYPLVGEDVLVTGAGPIGIMAAMVARHAGARHVVLTDINQDRLDLAGRIADITPVNTAKEDLMEVRARLGMREGFDVGMEMSGAAPAFAQMIEQMIMGGKIAVLGIPAKPIPTDWTAIVFKALVITGIYGREMFETWYKEIAMIQSGLDLRAIITDRLPVTDYKKGFERMGEGSCGKVVLDWG
ncbi:L-threonine 3-dehydrogenase [Oricola cellulosilytica]|uniref:L-threonine 3-dehydrogenase n=1 Tax=Oricola cellulosilytica TaxID=1429082 RepID=A0A4R0PE28_9HYPH|nr:L-threonine 3-dehydrogenase [Oricola cellulosilytica]TCD14599.1 L-threonine 3-dehydrogenase [Oricola cellulosilytica]